MMARLRSPLVSMIAISLCSLSGCVSVNIGGEKSERSKGVHASAPGGSFVPMENARADGAWKNPSNGNSISYLSVCNEQADPTLENATRELFGDMKSLVYRKQETTTFGGREALDSDVEGSVEGIPTRIRALVFKKNGCLYTLSLVGVAKKFDQDKGHFDEFLKHFEAP